MKTLHEYPGQCAGGCGDTIAYRLLQVNGGGYAPELSVPTGVVEYRGGHLCSRCADRVFAFLERGASAVDTVNGFPVIARVAIPDAPGRKKGRSLIVVDRGEDCHPERYVTATQIPGMDGWDNGDYRQTYDAAIRALLIRLESR